MRILLVFDSKYGNTEKIAQAMNTALSQANEVSLVRAAESKDITFSNFDLIIVGSPTNGGWPSPLAKAFLEAIPDGALKGKKAGAFDTGSTPDGEGFITKTAIKVFGYAAPRTAKMLASKGAEVLKYDTFYVRGMEGPIIEGEIERAQEWALSLTK
jgi:flavodoxin